MIDMDALLRGLPISGLEPKYLARLDGLLPEFTHFGRWSTVLWLLEPPAGRHVPYLAPVHSLYALLHASGIALDDAYTQAQHAVALLRHETGATSWFTRFDFYETDPLFPECLSAPDFLHWLRYSEAGCALHLLPALLDMLEQACEAALDTVFSGIGQSFTIKTMPELPTPKSMIEFVPCAIWDDGEDTEDWRNHPFYHWRDAMRPVADRLEQVLGEKVYYFADLDDELDDDNVHRFLVLHWCCTWCPHSSYVRYLLDISGTEHVEQLKAALIDPASYTHPFEMNDAFWGMETLGIPSFVWRQDSA